MSHTERQFAEKSGILLFGGASLAVSYFSDFHDAVCQRKPITIGDATGVVAKLLFTAAMLELLTEQSFLFPVAATAAVCSSAAALRII